MHIIYIYMCMYIECIYIYIHIDKYIIYVYIYIYIYTCLSTYMEVSKVATPDTIPCRRISIVNHTFFVPP